LTEAESGAEIWRDGMASLTDSGILVGRPGTVKETCWLT
jgi:hypothetical protein